MDNEVSFWEQDSFLKPYDLIVVGAGIVGLSSALFYKQSHPDTRVAVLERGFLPQGASTRNAGFACVGSVGEHLADMDKESEANIKKRIRRRYEGLKLLKSTLGEKEIGYEHCGGYEFFRSEEDFNNVAPHIDQFNRWMFELVDEEEVYEARKLQDYPVIYNRLEGALHPGKMMQTLAQKASRAGVEIKWNTTVDSIAKDGTVHLEGDYSCEANQVLVAANGFVPKLLPEIDIRPARGLLFVTDNIPNLKWKGIFHHDRGYVYFRNIDDRLLIGGARNLDKSAEQTDKFGENTTIKNYLTNFASNVLKLPDDWQIDRQWSGIMGFTSTKTPVITQLDTHRFVAAGLSGMGIAIGMDVGRKAAGKLQ
ncbi:Glycine/D-amino acid oxidase (deaminating) [Fodinibius salinus]|uniref:Glycine/D-amino acid oxidase (Deaminating) n=1 Tax=Fodinibius salinus TaxID=860790 RepID=A0A5D3YMY1_9BACT|nr:FAD-dependent oxidoreductase [Fodinibius salinus]TYP94061.1 Glycine/D-amino acid oxidase (deaminating) [Fodinibius salinus]